MRVAKLCLVFCVLFNTAHLYGISKGSDSVISIEPFFTFTSSVVDNQMLTFGFFKDGFALEDVATTCTFKSIFPVAGQVSLHGGQIYLDTDLILQNITSLETPGLFYANGHIVDLCEGVTGIPAWNDTVFHSANLCFKSDLTLSGTVKFKGDCSINGNGNRLILDNDAHIIVDPGSTLKFNNLELANITQGKLWCTDNSGSLILDNMRLVLSDDYSFTNGSIKFINNVIFTGSHTFFYQSNLTSTIASDSCWYHKDIITLSMGRKNGIYGNEPLYFQDSTSQLRMENGTLSITPSGARFINGTFLGDGEVVLDINSSNSTCGLILGNGIAENDLTFKMFPEAVIKVLQGHIVYDTISINNFFTDEVDVNFVRETDQTYLHFLHHIPFKNVTIKAEPADVITMAPNKVATFQGCEVETNSVDYVITGTRIDSYTYVLDGGKITLQGGDYSLNTTAYGTSNTINGEGNILGDVVLKNHLAELTLDLNGVVWGTSILNGGKIILGRNLNIDEDINLTGSGTLQAGDYNVLLPCKESTWTTTLRWSGDHSVMIFNANVNLSSEITVSGRCTIIGNHNKLNLSNTANIVIAKNSSLNLRNIQVSGVSGSNIRCIDDSASLYLEQSKIFMDNDFTFSRGSLYIERDVDLYGTSTFFYQSSLTSTIEANSQLHMCPGTWISISKKVGSEREPLYFEDNTSKIMFDNAGFLVPVPGMNLTRGRIVINRDTYISVSSTDTNEGVIVGGGAGSPEDNFFVEFNAGSYLNLVRGTMNYNNASPSCFISKTQNTNIISGPDFKLHLNQDITFRHLSLEFQEGTQVIVAQGKTITFDKQKMKFPGIEFEITGKRYDELTYLLEDDDEILVNRGAMPLATLVTGQNNIIQGGGSVGGPIYVQGAGAELTLSVIGRFYSDINLEGGTINLGRGIFWGPNKYFKGYGNINIASKPVFFCNKDLNWTSTINWDSNQGTLVLNAPIDLSSRWTLSGNCTILGNGNYFNFRPTGQIIVGRGSTLRLKDVKLGNIKENSVVCQDDTGKIIIQKAIWSQDENYTFSHGSLEINEKLKMMGPNKIFTYQTPQSSVVKEDTLMILMPEFKLSYAPSIASSDLLQLESETSKLILRNASLASTTTGIHLTKGTLEIHKQCYLESDATCKAEGVVFGDGVSEDNDLNIEIFSNANLSVPSGYLVYKNVS